MEVILPLDQMTTAEKLHAMEAIWENLSRNAESFESPAWHADVLREREQRIADGKEVSVDWEEAKRQLRERHL
ncbi:MAG: addiction module protein [Verrucomicrobia bacterium]|nr:addiction module protein [Verrucomicrobiota bacterium]